MQRYQGSKYAAHIGVIIDELQVWYRDCNLELQARYAARSRGPSLDKLEARKRWVGSLIELLEQAHSAARQAKRAGE